MVNHAIRNRVKKIKLMTKRMMHNTLSGDYLSAFRGTGLEFHQIRSYEQGDDVRSIDWNSSAKMGNIMVKEFVEDRERTIIVAMDTSSSLLYGSGNALKIDTVKDLAAAIICVAQDNKDNVGLVLFNDTVHHHIRPKKGSTHTSSLLNTIYQTEASGRTNLPALVTHLVTHPVRNAVLFIISDWLETDLASMQTFGAVAKLYDVLALHVNDPCEQALPDVGYLDLHDPETGELITVHATTANEHLAAYSLEQKRFFDRHRVSTLRVPAGSPFIPPLARFLQNRSRR